MHARASKPTECRYAIELMGLSYQSSAVGFGLLQLSYQGQAAGVELLALSCWGWAGGIGSLFMLLE